MKNVHSKLLNRPWLRGFVVGLVLIGLTRLDRMGRAQEPDVLPEELPSLAIRGIEASLASLEVAEGFRIEPVAWEPLVMDPVAMSFDEDGRLFIVEMRDYSERRPERMGRGRLLEDRNGDGIMDWSSVFVEDLPWPTAVICYDGGVFVGSTPDIFYFKDTDGDGRANVRETVFTGFASEYAPYETNRLNVQALMNSFRWGIDNRIHGVTSGAGGVVTSPKHPDRKALSLRGRDFSFDPRSLKMRAEVGGGQHGMAFDDFGQKFLCSNSDHIQQEVFPLHYLGKNRGLEAPRVRISIAEDGPAAPVFRLSPDEPWRVIRTRWRVAGRVRGPVEGGGRPSGYFTGATGVTIYRGDQWPSEYQGTALIGDCGSNLIHRKQLRVEGVRLLAQRFPEDEASEFVASRDHWFRPVQFANAPDGTLWVADMSREVIEHPWSLPQNIKRHLDLNRGNDAGRLYRIRATDNGLRPSRKLSALSTRELVALLRHPNGWHRDCASRLLFERQDASAGSILSQMLVEAQEPVARLHALYGLSSLGGLRIRDIEKGLRDESPFVRVHALRLVESLGSELGRGIERLLSDRAKDDDLRVVLQSANTLGTVRYEGRARDLYAILRHAGQDPWVQYAVLNAIGPDDEAFWSLVVEERAFWFAPQYLQVLTKVAQTVAPHLTLESYVEALEWAQTLDDPSHAIQLVLDLLIARDSNQENGIPAEVSVVLEDLVGEAEALVMRTDIVPSAAARALRLIGAVERSRLPELIRMVMSRNPPSELGLECIALSRGVSDSALIGWMSQQFPRFLPAIRKAFVEVYYEHGEDLMRVVDWVSERQLSPRDLTKRQREILMNHSDPGIRSRSEKLLAVPSVAPQQLMARLQPSLLMEADIAAGKRWFVERCALCHRLGNLGVDVGPSVASMRGLRKRGILESVLAPNREVAPQYYGLTLVSGATEQTGILRIETETSITLRQAGGIEVNTLKSRIDRVESTGMSLMPEGLLDDLGPQAVADLLEYLMYGEGDGESGQGLGRQ